MCSDNNNNQRHTHEVIGSVRIVNANGEIHNHRFAGMTGEAISSSNCSGSHYHILNTRTDFFNDHYHLIRVRVGNAIPVGQGRHIHFVYADTECSDGHKHSFIVATLINNPIGTNNSCTNTYRNSSIDSSIDTFSDSCR